MILHLGMFKRMSDHLLKASTTCRCASKAGMVGATSVASSAYHLLKRERLFEVSVYPFLCGFYPSYERFDHEVEDEWGERISLERAA